jgi:hypothetical protein
MIYGSLKRTLYKEKRNKRKRRCGDIFPILESMGYFLSSASQTLDEMDNMDGMDERTFKSKRAIRQSPHGQQVAHLRNYGA